MWEKQFKELLYKVSGRIKRSDSGEPSHLYKSKAAKYIKMFSYKGFICNACLSWNKKYFFKLFEGSLCIYIRGLRRAYSIFYSVRFVFILFYTSEMNKFEMSNSSIIHLKAFSHAPLFLLISRDNLTYCIIPRIETPCLWSTWHYIWKYDTE